MMRVVAFAAVLSMAVAAWWAKPAAAAEDPSYLVVGAGGWEVLRDIKPEFDLSYRSNYKLWIFKPHVGLLAAGDGDYYGYAGLLTDLYWGSHVVLTLSTAFGGYGGHGYNLGSHAEFRSGGDIAWRFDDRSRLGIGFYHISNAGLTNRNPGSESLLLNYSLPLDRLIGNSASSRTPPSAAVAGFSQSPR